jgi:hypothetical protein
MPANKTHIITAFNDTLYREYAHRFIDSFPKGLDLTVYSETDLPIPYTELTEKQFAYKHRDRPVTSYKYDGVRFHWKVQAVNRAVNELECDSVVWIDADTTFLKPLTQQWIDDNIATEHIMSYMGRVNYYSEMGLIYFNCKHPNTKPYIQEVWNYYVTDKIWDLQENHDSYLFDYVRVKREFENNWQFRNLAEHITHKVPGGHIAVHLYGDVMDHAKGKRKRTGKSPENTHNS